jgi:hypothetical protein
VVPSTCASESQGWDDVEVANMLAYLDVIDTSCCRIGSTLQVP